MAWLRSLYPGWRYVGLDVAAEGLRAARAIDEDVLQASALALPFPTASADLVVTLDVVQHLPFPDGDLARCARCAACCAPAACCCCGPTRTPSRTSTTTPPRSSAAYTEGALRDKLVAAGFEPLRLSRINALLGASPRSRASCGRGAERRDGRYHGLLAAPRPAGTADRLKRWWLRLEGRAVASGVRLPMAHDPAVCRARA
jgi:hypothetical protein